MLYALLRNRPLLWLVLALPALWNGWRWVVTPDEYGFGHAIGDSGLWSVWLLMATMAITPLRLMAGPGPLVAALARRRRDLGVASFAYAALHTAIYLWDQGTLARIAAQVPQPEILAGWVTLALFLPLAITSNDASVRWLRRGWRRLHRLVYPAAILTFVHWVLTAFDPASAWAHAAALAAIELARVILQRRQRVT